MHEEDGKYCKIDPKRDYGQLNFSIFEHVLKRNRWEIWSFAYKKKVSCDSQIPHHSQNSKR